VVVVAGRFLDFVTDLVDAAVDLFAIAGASDDRRVVLVDDDALGAPELLDRRMLELQAKLLGNHPCVRQNCDVFKHGLAAIAESGGLDGAAFQDAADLVDDEPSVPMMLRQ
jgi:hypothetical protein